MDFEATVQKILWGKSINEVRSNYSPPRIFILRSLTIKETNFVNYIHDKEYESALLVGILKQEDLAELHKESGVWTLEHDEHIESLRKQVKKLKAAIKGYQLMKTKKKQTEKKLKKIQDEIIKQEEIKNSLFYCSAESRAEEISRRYTIMLSAQDKDENKFWINNDDFLNCNDHRLVFELAKAYYSNNMFDIKILRAVARCPSWRFRWNASKNGADLFGKPICDWSEMQNLIVYWSQFYDGVYESAERPSDFIIEDDNACDAWAEEQNKKLKISSSSNQEKNRFGTKKAKTTKDHQEEFVMVQRGDEETIKDLQESNISSVRQRLRKEYEMIKNSKHRVKEWDLRKAGV